MDLPRELLPIAHWEAGLSPRPRTSAVTLSLENRTTLQVQSSLILIAANEPVASRSTSEESLLFTCVYLGGALHLPCLLCGSITQLLFSCRIHHGFTWRTTQLCPEENKGNAGQRWKLEPDILAVLCQSSRDTCICAPAIAAFPWR